MSFNTVTIQRELRHLLIGQYEREGQRRATRNSDSFSTAVGCPDTNAAFVSQSRVGAEWKPSDTWEQVRRELENASPNKAGAEAALYLLHQVDPPEGLSRADQQMWRQKKAANVLGMIWAKDKFRFRDDRTVKFASDIVDRAVTALQDALRDAVASTAVALSVAAQQRFEQNAEQIGIEEDLKSSIIQRLESLPGHYPAHLTTSVLAPLLNPHVRAAEERQVIDSVPVLPPFPRDEFDEVSQLLRTEGARTFITGEPGSGKSTLLRFVAMKQMNELTGSVGIFLSIADLSRVLLERSMTLSEVLNMVVDLTDEVLTSLNSDAKAYILRRLEFDDSSVICLDGLDEVPEGILTERAQRAIDVLSRIPGSIVVSSRPKPRTITSGDWTAITMRPMSDDRANQLFDLWFENPDDPRKARARDALLSDAGHSMRVPAVIVTGQGAAVPISRSPLILGFVAFAASFDREYDSITDLYEQYIALTLERIWKAPGLREYNDVKIEHMMRLLRVLAWHMAGGARDDSEWRDAESLQRILQVTKLSDREYLARIVQAEGLFSLATPAASRLHTSYRWVHRTVQEHLVAMYLLEEDSRDPDVMVHRLLEGLSGSDDWRVIIKHAFTKMTPDVQARLVEQLVSAQDDSRYITGEAGNLLLNLAPFVRAEKVAQIIATDARRRGMWPTFFYVDARNARAALLETAKKETPIRAMGARFPQLASTFDVQYLLDLHSRLIERPKLHFARLLEVCLALETRQPLAGVTAYFDVIAAGPPGLLRTEWPEELVGRMDIRSISRRISEHTELSVRWRLVYFLMKNLRVDPAPFVKPNGPLDVVEFNLAQIVERRITGDTYSVGETLKAALSGEFGDAIAYVAAQSFVAPVMRNVVKHSWGIVGAWEQLLVSEEIGDPGALLQPEDSSAAEIISQYRTDWRRDPAKMAQLYEALWKGKRNPASVETSVLVEFYRLIVCDLDRSKFDYVHACVPVSVLTKIIFPILRRHGWATVADVILRQDAELWVGSKGRIPALEEFFLGEYWISGDGWSGDQFEEHWDSMSGLLSRIVSWGSEAGIAMLQVSRPAISVARAFEELPIFDLNPEVFSLPENLAWLDRILLFKFEREWRYFRSEYLAEVRFASSDLSRTVVDVWHLESLFDQK